MNAGDLYSTLVLFSGEYYFNVSECMNCESKKFSTERHVNPGSAITGCYSRCVVCYECNWDYLANFLLTP